MQNKLIGRGEVLEVVKNLFMQEHQTLKAHPVNEQIIIGNKLTVIEIELKKLIKGLAFIETREDSICIEDSDQNEKQKKIASITKIPEV